MNTDGMTAEGRLAAESKHQQEAALCALLREFQETKDLIHKLNDERNLARAKRDDLYREVVTVADDVADREEWSRMIVGRWILEVNGSGIEITEADIVLPETPDAPTDTGADCPLSLTP